VNTNKNLEKKLKMIKIFLKKIFCLARCLIYLNCKLKKLI